MKTFRVHYFMQYLPWNSRVFFGTQLRNLFTEFPHVPPFVTQAPSQQNSLQQPHTDQMH